MTEHDATESQTVQTPRLTVDRTYTQNGCVVGREAAVEPIEITPWKTAPAYVTFGESRSINTGNYNSTKIEVRVSLPAYVEQIQEAYLAARAFVQRRLAYEVGELMKGAPQ